MRSSRVPGPSGTAVSAKAPSSRVKVTDLATFTRQDGPFVLTAVPEGTGTLDERIDRARRLCGWEVEVGAMVTELAAPTADEVEALRRWDPEQRFLRPDRPG